MSPLLSSKLPRKSAKSPATAEQAQKIDPDLAKVNAAWPDLPAAIKAGVLALVKAASAR
jgi:hypothetical protein